MQRISFYAALGLAALMAAGLTALPRASRAQQSIIDDKSSRSENVRQTRADNKATVRESGTGRAPVGDVLLNGTRVLQIREGAGGMTPVQRAERVARRLNELAAAGKLRSEDLAVRDVGDGAGLYAGQELIATAERGQAEAGKLTPRRLAESWRDDLSSALVDRQPGSSQPSVKHREQPPVAVAQPEVELKTKLVPILTVGSSGSIGVAQVTGPEEQVNEVRAVAQLATDYRDKARIRMLVPIHTEHLVEHLQRVPQVAVTGIGDIRF